MAVLETVLTVTIALAVVVGLQMVGVVLMAAMVIAPAVAARQWTRRLEHMVVLAAALRHGRRRRRGAGQRHRARPGHRAR